VYIWSGSDISSAEYDSVRDYVTQIVQQNVENANRFPRPQLMKFNVRITNNQIIGVLMFIS